MTVSKSTRPLFGWSVETPPKSKVSKPKSGPMWNDVENIPDHLSAVTIDAQVEMRCKSKRLADCELPEGFWLVTPMPKQYWIDQQLRWSFELGFGKEHRHVAQYLQQVSDEVQMQWAVEDFTAKLLFEGVSLEQTRKRESLTPRKVAIAFLA